MSKLIFVAILWISSCAGGSPRPVTSLTLQPAADTGQIKSYLRELAPRTLNFPNLVRDLYTASQYRYLWAAPDMQEQLRQAQVTLDCVTQFGLIAGKYHREALTADRFRLLSTEGEPKSPATAEADILLTDAILTFMFHLHFGQCNPRISFQHVDRTDYPGYRIDSVFKESLGSPEFRERILQVQPQNPRYQVLQEYQRLITGQYAGDCYDIPEDTVRLIALNLERYRWENTDEPRYLEINIPSFYLRYREGQEEHSFKVIVGKPSSPTPTFQSRIDHFTTAPDWTVPPSIFRKELLPKALADPGYLSRNGFTIYNRRGEPVSASRENLLVMKEAPHKYVARQSSGCDNALGRIVFYFQNPYSVYLHDTPSRALFDRTDRALSHGCIRVDDPERLAALLLRGDGASPATEALVNRHMEAYSTYRYRLLTPVPIIVRYITCEVENGILVRYPDLYKRDKVLADQLFGSGSTRVPSRTGR